MNNSINEANLNNNLLFINNNNPNNNMPPQQAVKAPSAPKIKFILSKMNMLAASVFIFSYDFRL
jgi:hypothetical protein